MYTKNISNEEYRRIKVAKETEGYKFTSTKFVINLNGNNGQDNNYDIELPDPKTLENTNKMRKKRTWQKK